MHTNNDNSGIPLSSFDDMDKGRKGPAIKTQGLRKDSDSEEAILFERSVQVTYEDAPQNRRTTMQQHQPEVWAGNRA